MKPRYLVFALLFTACAASAQQLPLDEIAYAGGLCCVAGETPSTAVQALLDETNLRIHVLEPREDAAAALSSAWDMKGVGIERLVVECLPCDRLPYPANTLDLVAVFPGASVTGGECMRALRPGGTCFRLEAGSWQRTVKPPVEAMGDWSHWEHGPDNNPVSTDTHITYPYMTKWLGLPYYIAMPAITTAAGGRTFLAMGHIAHHRREERWLNTVIARNGFNGEMLWHRRVPAGYLVHRSAFVATDDIFYMIEENNRGCLMLDPETGEELGRIHLDEVSGPWKWIAIQDGVLYVLAGGSEDPAEQTLVRSEFPAWSWGELSDGYYQPRVPWGFGEVVAAYDLASESVQWVHREDAPIDSRGMAIGGGRMYLYCPDAHLRALELATGRPEWSNDDAGVRQLIEKPGRGLVSTPGFRTTCLCVYTPETLVYQGQTRANVVGISPDDGSMLWTQPKTSNNPNALYLDGELLLGIGPEGDTLQLNPVTGDLFENMTFQKRSCARLTATSDSVFCRGWPEGITRYDRRTGEIQYNGAVRPACNDGVIGANGHLYIGPWLCDCNLSLMGTLALGPAEDIEEEPVAERLEHAADLKVQNAVRTAEADWFAYRGGNAHTGGSPAPLGENLSPIWAYVPERPFEPTAPTAAGGLVFLAGRDGKVRAIDAATGLLLWAHQTAGPVLQPPTAWKGRVFAGSSDGWVYAFEAATGRLLWRFRAAPTDRRIMVYDRLCSTWPVHTGVVVHEDTVYCAAGIIDYDGTYVYALDAATGEVKWSNGSTGHLDSGLRKGVSAQGNLTIMDDTLWMAGGNVVSPAPYDLDTGEYTGPPVKDGSPMSNRGEEIAVFANRYLLFGGRLRFSAPDNIVSPARFAIARKQPVEQGFPETGLCASRVAPAWDDELLVLVPERGAAPAAIDAKQFRKDLGELDRNASPHRVWQSQYLENTETEALALAPDAVVAAAKFPRFRSLQPRWVLAVLDRASGNQATSFDLPGQPLLNGTAIDRDGRILVELTDGSLVCFGGSIAADAHIQALMEKAETSNQARDRSIRLLHDSLARTHEDETQQRILRSLSELGLDARAPAHTNGAITDWQLLGPVPWDRRKPGSGTELANEPEMNPEHEYQAGGATFDWRGFVTVHENGAIDLAALWGEDADLAAFAYAELEFNEPRRLQLAVGSNDGFVCWVNGKEVGRFDGGRAYGPDQDIFPVSFQAGINRILLKVTQHGGGWGFGARLLDMDGKSVDIGEHTR